MAEPETSRETHKASEDPNVARRVLEPLYPAVTIDAEPNTEAITGHATFQPTAAHEGAPGWLQGGLSATVLDYVSARIANEALSSRVATGTLELRYRQPVRLNAGPFRVVGSAPTTERRTVRVTAAILDADGRPLVEASGLFVAVER